jgi:hypothetical protein
MNPIKIIFTMFRKQREEVESREIENIEIKGPSQINKQMPIESTNLISIKGKNWDEKKKVEEVPLENEITKKEENKFPVIVAYLCKEFTKDYTNPGDKKWVDKYIERKSMGYHFKRGNPIVCKKCGSGDSSKGPLVISNDWAGNKQYYHRGCLI